jgi:hypothetical protein
MNRPSWVACCTWAPYSLWKWLRQNRETALQRSPGSVMAPKVTVWDSCPCGWVGPRPLPHLHRAVMWGSLRSTETFLLGSFSGAQSCTREKVRPVSSSVRSAWAQHLASSRCHGIMPADVMPQVVPEYQDGDSGPSVMHGPPVWSLLTTWLFTFSFKNSWSAGCWCHTPVIPATFEAEIRELRFVRNSSPDSISKIPK